MSNRDYYEILGLMPGADGAMVDQAYWHCARKCQKAAVADPRARQQLDDLNEAYGVLGTPRLRAQYDAFRDDVLVAESGGKRWRAARNETHDNGSAGREGGLLHSIRTGLASLGKRAPSIHITLPSALVDGSPEMSTTDAHEPAWEPVPAPVAPAQEIEAPLEPRTRGKHGDNASANEIQASTAAMISRWRNSVGLQAPVRTADDPNRSPDTTLVEIFQSEQDVASQSEPLTAVIDILRGSRPTPELR